jgi:hypothetical protein
LRSDSPMASPRENRHQLTGSSPVQIAFRYNLMCAPA